MDIICCEKRTVFREHSLRKTELRGTGNVQGQISEHNFTPNGGCCVNYPSNLFLHHIQYSSKLMHAQELENMQAVFKKS